MSIYASAPVITALAELEKTGESVQSKEQLAAVMALISAMRKEGAGRGQAVSADILLPILFGLSSSGCAD